MQVVTCVVRHVMTYDVTHVMTALLGQVVKNVMAKAGMQDHSHLIVGNLLTAASITRRGLCSWFVSIGLWCCSCWCSM
jgi:hypothetical protein